MLQLSTRSMHFSSNRKALQPGDVPSEIWRIVSSPQWILPTLKVKWGLGHDGLYDKAGEIKHVFKKLLSVVYNTECLPVQSACNIGCNLPKKNMSHTAPSTAVGGIRTIHL